MKFLLCQNSGISMKGAKISEYSGLRPSAELRAEHRIIAAYEVTSMARIGHPTGTLASPLKHLLSAVAVAAIGFSFANQVFAQQNGGGNTIGGGATAGVAVDANGVL